MLPGEALMLGRELLLQLRRIEQDEPRELDGPPGRVDRAGEAKRARVRDQTAVVEVRVREQQRVDRRGLVGERNAVAEHVVRAALEHPAVDEHARAVGLEEVLRAGHRARGAEELEAHPRMMPR